MKFLSRRRRNEATDIHIYEDCAVTQAKIQVGGVL